MTRVLLFVAAVGALGGCGGAHGVVVLGNRSDAAVVNPKGRVLQRIPVAGRATGAWELQVPGRHEPCYAVVTGREYRRGGEDAGSVILVDREGQRLDVLHAPRRTPFLDGDGRPVLQSIGSGRGLCSPLESGNFTMFLYRGNGAWAPAWLAVLQPVESGGRVTLKTRASLWNYGTFEPHFVWQAPSLFVTTCNNSLPKQQQNIYGRCLVRLDVPAEDALPREGIGPVYGHGPPPLPTGLVFCLGLPPLRSVPGETRMFGGTRGLTTGDDGNLIWTVHPPGMESTLSLSVSQDGTPLGVYPSPALETEYTKVKREAEPPFKDWIAGILESARAHLVRGDR